MHALRLKTIFVLLLLLFVIIIISIVFVFIVIIISIIIVIIIRERVRERERAGRQTRNTLWYNADGFAARMRNSTDGDRWQINTRWSRNLRRTHRFR